MQVRKLRYEILLEVALLCVFDLLIIQVQSMVYAASEIGNMERAREKPQPLPKRFRARNTPCSSSFLSLKGVLFQALQRKGSNCNIHPPISKKLVEKQCDVRYQRHHECTVVESSVGSSHPTARLLLMYALWPVRDPCKLHNRQMLLAANRRVREVWR